MVLNSNTVSLTVTAAPTTGTVIVTWSSGTAPFQVTLYHNSTQAAGAGNVQGSPYTFNNIPVGYYYAIILDSKGETISTSTGLVQAGQSVTLIPGGNIPVFSQLMALMPDNTAIPLTDYNPASPPGTVVATYQGSNVYQAGTGDAILGEIPGGYIWQYPLPFYYLQSNVPNSNNYIPVDSVTAN